MGFIVSSFFYLSSCLGISFGQQGVFLTEMAQPPFLQITPTSLKIKTSNSIKNSSLLIYEINLKVDTAFQSIMISAKQAIGKPYKDEFEIDLVSYNISNPENYSFYWLNPEGHKTKLEVTKRK